MRAHRALLVVIGIGLAIRLAFFAAAYHYGGGLAAAHSANTSQYLQTAKSLMSTGQFAVDGTPELLRSPGYPLFLIPGLVAGQPELVTIALQLLLSAATIWLIHDIVLSWTGRRAAALAAAILAAIEPLSVNLCYVLMTEKLFTFLMVLSVRQLLRYLSTESFVALAQTAILLALATFVRPVNYYLPTILTALLFAHALWRTEGRLRAAGYAAMFWAVSMSPLIAWQVRNYTETGYSGFAAIADFNLYFFHGAAVIAHQRGVPVETAQAELGFTSPERFDRLHPELDPGDQAARFHYLHVEGKRLIRENPWTFAKIYLRGLAILTFNPGASEVLCTLHCLPTDRPLRPANMGLLGLARQMQATAPQLVLQQSLPALRPGQRPILRRAWAGQSAAPAVVAFRGFDDRRVLFPGCFRRCHFPRPVTASRHAFGSDPERDRHRPVCGLVESLGRRQADRREAEPTTRQARPEDAAAPACPTQNHTQSPRWIQQESVRCPFPPFRRSRRRANIRIIWC